MEWGNETEQRTIHNEEYENSGLTAYFDSCFPAQKLRTEISSLTKRLSQIVFFTPPYIPCLATFFDGPDASPATQATSHPPAQHSQLRIDVGQNTCSHHHALVPHREALTISCITCGRSSHTNKIKNEAMQGTKEKSFGGSLRSDQRCAPWLWVED